MLFRRKSSAGRHRGSSQKELKRVANPKTETPPPTIEDPVEAADPELAPAALPALPSLSSESDLETADTITERVKELLASSDVEPVTSQEVLGLLQDRRAILDKLGGMNVRIDRLVLDASKNEAILDELKLDAHFRELADDRDEGELVRESWDTDPAYVARREALERGVQLLIRMEASRSQLMEAYVPVVEKLMATLPTGDEQLHRELCELLSEDLEVFKQVHGHSLREGELVEIEDDSSETVQEFLRELNSSGVDLKSEAGDSLFHLDQ